MISTLIPCHLVNRYALSFCSLDLVAIKPLWKLHNSKTTQDLLAAKAQVARIPDFFWLSNDMKLRVLVKNMLKIIYVSCSRFKDHVHLQHKEHVRPSCIVDRQKSRECDCLKQLSVAFLLKLCSTHLKISSSMGSISSEPNLIKLNPWPASEFWPKFSFRIYAKIQPQSLDQTQASKSWPKFSFKISTKL